MTQRTSSTCTGHRVTTRTLAALGALVMLCGQPGGHAMTIGTPHDAGMPTEAAAETGGERALYSWSMVRVGAASESLWRIVLGMSEVLPLNDLSLDALTVDTILKGEPDPLGVNANQATPRDDRRDRGTAIALSLLERNESDRAMLVLEEVVATTGNDAATAWARAQIALARGDRQSASRAALLASGLSGDQAESHMLWLASDSVRGEARASLLLRAWKATSREGSSPARSILALELSDALLEVGFVRAGQEAAWAGLLSTSIPPGAQPLDRWLMERHATAIARDAERWGTIADLCLLTGDERGALRAARRAADASAARNGTGGAIAETLRIALLSSLSSEATQAETDANEATLLDAFARSGDDDERADEAAACWAIWKSHHPDLSDVIAQLERHAQSTHPRLAWLRAALSASIGQTIDEERLLTSQIISGEAVRSMDLLRTARLVLAMRSGDVGGRLAMIATDHPQLTERLARMWVWNIDDGGERDRWMLDARPEDAHGVLLLRAAVCIESGSWEGSERALRLLTQRAASSKDAQLSQVKAAGIGMRTRIALERGESLTIDQDEALEATEAAQAWLGIERTHLPVAATNLSRLLASESSFTSAVRSRADAPRFARIGQRQSTSQTSSGPQRMLIELLALAGEGRWSEAAARTVARREVLRSVLGRGELLTREEQELLDPGLRRLRLLVRLRTLAPLPPEQSRGALDLLRALRSSVQNDADSRMLDDLSILSLRDDMPRLIETMVMKQGGDAHDREHDWQSLDRVDRLLEASGQRAARVRLYSLVAARTSDLSDSFALPTLLRLAMWGEMRETEDLLAELERRGTLLAFVEAASMQEQDSIALDTLDAQRSQFYYLIANLAQSQRRDAFASALYERSLTLMPRHAWACNNYGYMLLERGGEAQRVEGMILASYEQLSDNASVIDTLGWLRYKQGRLDDWADEAGRRQPGAITLLTLASRMSQGDNAEVMLHLGDALHRAALTATERGDRQAPRLHERAVAAWLDAYRTLGHDLIGMGIEPDVENVEQRSIVIAYVQTIRERRDNAAMRLNPALSPEQRSRELAQWPLANDPEAIKLRSVVIEPLGLAETFTPRAEPDLPPATVNGAQLDALELAATTDVVNIVGQ